MGDNVTMAKSSRVLCLLTATTLLTATFSGCVSGVPDAKPNYSQTDRRKLSRDTVMKLPGAVNEGNYRSLVISVDIKDIQGLRNGENSPEMCDIITEFARTRLEVEMAKLKRFTVVAVHNTAAARQAEKLSEVGQVTMPTSANPPPTVDLTLNSKLLATRTRIPASSDKDYFVFQVQGDYTLNVHSDKLTAGDSSATIDSAGTISDALKSVGKCTAEAVYNGGQFIGGHRPEDDRERVYEAAMRSLADLANQLGNRYPVGGKISAILGERMSVQAGSKHGIGVGQQMAVYFKTKSNIRIPLAYAEATPSPMTSDLVVWRWNTDDKTARQIIRQIQDDPDWLSKHDGELWAVSYGMAIPPDWETPYAK